MRSVQQAGLRQVWERDDCWYENSRRRQLRHQNCSGLPYQLARNLRSSRAHHFELCWSRRLSLRIHSRRNAARVAFTTRRRSSSLVLHLPSSPNHSFLLRTAPAFQGHPPTCDALHLLRDHNSWLRERGRQGSEWALWVGALEGTQIVGCCGIEEEMLGMEWGAFVDPACELEGTGEGGEGADRGSGSASPLRGLPAGTQRHAKQRSLPPCRKVSFRGSRSAFSKPAQRRLRRRQFRSFPRKSAPHDRRLSLLPAAQQAPSAAQGTTHHLLDPNPA